MLGQMTNGENSRAFPLNNSNNKGDSIDSNVFLLLFVFYFFIFFIFTKLSSETKTNV